MEQIFWLRGKFYLRSNDHRLRQNSVNWIHLKLVEGFSRCNPSVMSVSKWTYNTYTIIRYKPSVKITPYFLTPLMLCVLILYMSGGTYSFRSALKDKFVRNFSWQIDLLSDVLPEIYWDICFSIFRYVVFCDSCDLCHIRMHLRKARQKV